MGTIGNRFHFFDAKVGFFLEKNKYKRIKMKKKRKYADI